MGVSFSDNFNRADGGLGASWTEQGTAHSIISNQVQPAASPGSGAYWNGGTPPANCWSQIKIPTLPTSTDAVQVGARYDSAAANVYQFRYSPSTPIVQRVTGGSPTTILTLGSSPAANDDVRIEVRDTSIEVYYNNVSIGSVTDATYTGANRAAIGGVGTSGRIDDFGCGSLPTLSSPTATNVSSSGASLGATTDESAGTLYAVLDSAANLSGVTRTQVFQGKRADGATAAFSQNGAISTATPSLSFTGLSAGVTYSYAIVQINGGYANLVTGSFTTEVPGASDGPGFVIGDEAGFVGEGAVGAPNAATPGAMTGSINFAFGQSGVMSGAGALQGSIGLSLTPSGALSGVGALSGAVSLSFGQAGALLGVGALTSAITIALSASGALTGAGALVGNIPLALTAAGGMSGAGALAGSVSFAWSVAGTLSTIGSGAMTGAIATAFAQTGALAGMGALTGSVALTFAEVGALSGAGALLGSIPFAFTAAGALTGAGSGAMTGAISMNFAEAGALSGAGAFVGSIPVAFSATGLLQGAGALVGAVPISFAQAGQLAGAGALFGLIGIAWDAAGLLSALGALGDGSASRLILAGTQGRLIRANLRGRLVTAAIGSRIAH